MRNVFAALLFLSGVLSPALAQECLPTSGSGGAPPEKFRYSFLVDTSGSMVGRGDGRAVIFPKVQQEMARFVEGIRGDAEVWITTFDQGPRPTNRYTLPAEKDKLMASIRNLQALGNNTWLYRSMNQVFDGIPQDARTANIIYIFTDGIDNDPNQPRVGSSLERYRLKQGPSDFIYYVALGQAVPQDIAAAFKAIPQACAISAALGTLPKFSTVFVEPTQIDLGNLKLNPGDKTVELEFQYNGDPVVLKVQVEGGVGSANLRVSPDSITPGVGQVRFSLENAGGLGDGLYPVNLRFTGPPGTVVSPAVVPVKLAYHPGALYRLVPVNVPATLNLGPKPTSLTYRLEGNQWATEPIQINLKNLAQGLGVRFSGNPGPITVKPGESFSLDLSGKVSGRFDPSFNAFIPAGARIELPGLPRLAQQGAWPWWLLIPFLPFLVWLLFFRPKPEPVLAPARVPAAGFVNPSRTVEAIAPPSLVKEVPRPVVLREPFAKPSDPPRVLELFGHDSVDLGELWKLPSLEGLRLMPIAGGAKVAGLPTGVSASNVDRIIKVGDVLKFGDILKLSSGGVVLGSILLATRKIAESSKAAASPVAVPKAESPTVNVDLRYLGGKPELRQNRVAVNPSGIDLGVATGDGLLSRLTLIPTPDGIRIVHVPGHLLLSTLFDRHLTPGETVAVGQSIYIKDLSGASLGVVDVARD
jgi:hypothetical protein